MSTAKGCWVAQMLACLGLQASAMIARGLAGGKKIGPTSEFSHWPPMSRVAAEYVRLVLGVVR
jgi:hypothetical protein